jgi:hypothetical protein
MEVCRRIAPLIFDLSSTHSGKLSPPATLPTGKESPVPAEQEAGFGPRAGRDTLEKKKTFVTLAAITP